MGKKPAKSKVFFDSKMAAQVLTDAKILGSDTAAAKKWNVTERTVRRYRARLVAADNPELSEEVLRLEKDALGGWATERVKTLNAVMVRARELLPTVTDLAVLGKFAADVGGVDMAIGALGSESARTPPEGSGPPEAEGRPGEGAGGDGGGESEGNG